MYNFLLRLLALVAVILPILVIIIIGIMIYPMEPPAEQPTPVTATQRSRFVPARDGGTSQELLQPSGVVIDNTRIVRVTIRRLKFIPDPIIVVEGETVRLEVTSQDAPHNIAIEDLNINQKVEPLAPETIEFTADRPGRYSMTCSVNCGIADRHLEGELIIQEKAE
ncbi:MAG: hypothetical protein GX629_01865 [Phycisphaerae bacterium]|nr:hypothetical protein [Phycisphaerae bacterium]